MRPYVDHVLALLPFEPEAMNELGGPPCTYVGHPLIERLVELRPNELKRGRRADPPLVLVLPGSRNGEIRRMAPVFGAAIARVAEQYGPLELSCRPCRNLPMQCEQPLRMAHSGARYN